jgi:hypothetical protein
MEVFFRKHTSLCAQHVVCKAMHVYELATINKQMRMHGGIESAPHASSSMNSYHVGIL